MDSNTLQSRSKTRTCFRDSGPLRWYFTVNYSESIHEKRRDLMGKRTSKRQDEEFENFKNLTSKLLAVSKKELDKQKAAYQEKKSGNTK